MHKDEWLKRNLISYSRKLRRFMETQPKNTGQGTKDNSGIINTRGNHIVTEQVCRTNQQPTRLIRELRQMKSQKLSIQYMLHCHCVYNLLCFWICYCVFIILICFALLDHRTCHLWAVLNSLCKYIFCWYWFHLIFSSLIVSCYSNLFFYFFKYIKYYIS